MIVDLQTHVWKQPGHLSEEFVREVASGRDQGRLKPGDWSMDLGDHWLAAEPVDRSVVSAFVSRHLGVEVPNDYVAQYVREHEDKLIGFAGVDPHDKRACQELESCVKELGMRGVALSPAYQNFHPADTRAMFLYEAANELKVPVMMHLGGSYSHSAPLKFSLPVLLEDVALEFPDLKIVVAHLGYPWTVETALLVKKQPNVYAEISGMTNKPWQFYNAMITAVEYGVADKLLFGSDWPFATPARAIEALYSVNQMPQGTSFPVIPRETLRGIMERDALSLLGIGEDEGKA